MKLICGLILSIIIGSALCGSNAFGQQIITPEQARQAVCDFEGETSLNFDSVNQARDDDPTSPYILEINETGRGWFVNALTGEVSSASYLDRYSEYQDEPFGSISQDDCEAIALAYASSKYTGFDDMNFQLKDPEWKSHGWRFEWIQKLDYDALTKNRVVVDVNPVSGEIQYYSSFRVPVTAPHQPQITIQQAIDLAVQAFGIASSVEVKKGPILVVDPQGSVYWIVVLGGLDAQGYYIRGSVALNAETGDIYDQKIASGGGTGKHESSAASVSTGKMLPIREIAKQIPKARVHWLGKDGARLTVDKAVYKLKPGSASVESNGKQIKLSRKMELAKGRLMVPVELQYIVKAGSR